MNTMTNNPLIRRKIEVKSSPLQGHGVFACETILRGEVIEECYLIPGIKTENYASNYSFDIKNPNYYGLPLGHGCIYNHSRKKNANWEFDKERSLFVITAIDMIKPGDEILISYGEAWFGARHVPERKYKVVKKKQNDFWSLFFFFLRFGIITGIVFCLVYSISVLQETGKMS
jgi:uncharacterized protein